MKVGVVKRRVEIPYILNKGMADSRKRSRRRQRRRRPAPSHPKKRDVVSDPKGKTQSAERISDSKDARKAEKTGQAELPKILATAYPGPGAATAGELPGVPAGRACHDGEQEFVGGDAERWATAMMVFNVGLARVSLPILPFHSLVLVSRQACVIGPYALLGEATLIALAEALELTPSSLAYLAHSLPENRL